MTNRRVLVSTSVVLAVVILAVIGMLESGRVCIYHGLRWGGKFPAADGCNVCSCARGRVICTAMDCAGAVQLPSATGGTFGSAP
jgi:hypothetical protein